MSLQLPVDKAHRRSTRKPRRKPAPTDVTEAVANGCLSAVDAAFLYLERKEIPLHMASVSIFDGPVAFDEFVASIERKLYLIPRYKQIAVLPPYNLGPPTWESAPNFDIRQHIFRVTLEPPGGDAQLEALAGRILSQLMDRRKPMWDMYVVDGLKDGRGALIARLHHSLADGVSGVAILNQLMLDPTPEGDGPIAKRRFHTPAPQPSEHSLADSIGKALHSTLDNLIAAEQGLLGFAQALTGGGEEGGRRGLAGLLPELAASVERLPFNKPCGGKRKFCWTEFDFAEVQAIRKAAGGTVNDVVLAVLTRALARYVKLHGQSVVNRFVRMVCPVSLRQGEQNGNLGNQISFLPVALPMDITDPVQMLEAVTTRTEIMKRGTAADLVALIASWIAAAPPPLQALFWWGIPQLRLPLPLFNMICTNIPGSAVPLYAGGRRMIATYPQVPTGYELGAGCAVTSYDGKIFCGLTADADAAPDVGRLRDFLNVSYRELCRAAGVKRARRPRKTAKAPPSKPAEAVAAVAPERPTETPPEPGPEPIVMNDKAVA
jgi:diacylglycerol O-acyltransferase